MPSYNPTNCVLANITLTINGISLTYAPTIERGNYREPQPGLNSTASVSYDNSRLFDGVPYADYEKQLIWNFQMIGMTETEKRALSKIVAEQSRLATTAPYTDYEIVLTDEVELFQEYAASPTRQTNGLAHQSTGDGYIEYYGKFNVAINADIYLAGMDRIGGSRYNAAVQLTELTKLTP